MSLVLFMPLTRKEKIIFLWEECVIIAIIIWIKYFIDPTGRKIEKKQKVGISIFRHGKKRNKLPHTVHHLAHYYF